MLSKELEYTLNAAFREAREKRHEFVTVEHLLLALVDEPDAAKVLKACGADMEKLRAELTAFVDGSTGVFADAFTYYELTGDEAAPPQLLKAVPNTGPASGGTARRTRRCRNDLAG